MVSKRKASTKRNSPRMNGKAKKSPKKTGTNGESPPQDQCEETGRFVPGNRAAVGHGRPPGYDFRKIVTEESKRNNISVEAAVWSIYGAMIVKARSGDVQAAKLLLDRLCESDPIKLEHSASVDGPVIPATAELAQGIKQLSELADELLDEDA